MRFPIKIRMPFFSFDLIFKKKHEQTGSIFILALWTLLFLSVFTFSVGYMVQQKIRAVKSLESRQTLRHLAESGVKKAMSFLPNDQPDLPFEALNQKWSMNVAGLKDVEMAQGSFSVVKYANGFGDARYKDDFRLGYGMIDEESKLNINTIKAKPLAILLEEAAGISSERSLPLAEAIVDFRDKDETSHPDGAESSYYQRLKPSYRAKNANFDVLEEMRFVKGMTAEMYAKIAPYLTPFSNGKINLNTASEPVLRSLGLDRSLVGVIVSYRKGPDQVWGTADDGIFNELSQVPLLLTQFAQLSESETAAIEAVVNSGDVDIRSAHFWIQSIGKLNYQDRKLLIQCVTDRDGNTVYWYEKYI